MSARIRAASAALLLLAIVRPAAAAPAGFAFLEVPVGARAAGLGGAFSSLAEGAESMFWNPAGLTAASKLQVAGSHAELFERLRHEGFAVAFPYRGGGLGAAVRALYSEPITERDVLGNEIGTFGAHDLEFSLAFGWKARGDLQAGVSAQVVRERIASFSATTFALGVSATWTPPALPGVRVAAVAQHLGPAARYGIAGTEGEPVSLPAAFQSGVSYAKPAGAVMLRGVLESRWTRGRSGVAMLGAELEHGSGATLRGGYRLNDDAARVSAGGGWGTGPFTLDYAWIPYRLDLGDSHRVSFSARF